MAGRYPRPTGLKILDGNPGKRPLPAAEPQYELGSPEKPEDLDPVASSEWDRMVALLTEKKVLTVADGSGLEAYCRWFALFRVSVKAAQAKKPGTKPQKLAFLQARQASQEMRQFLVQYGMTPASRPRVRGHGATQKDPYEEYLGHQ